MKLKKVKQLTDEYDWEIFFVDENGVRQGTYEKYHDNGQLWEKYTYKDGKEEGLYQEYFPSGKLRRIFTFKDGKMDGPYIEFYENGFFRTQCVYKDDLKDGPYLSFHENGKIYAKCTYGAHGLEGPYTAWYEKGGIMKKGFYKNGQEHGLEETYDEMGVPMIKGVYWRGTLLPRLAGAIYEMWHAKEERALWAEGDKPLPDIWGDLLVQQKKQEEAFKKENSKKEAIKKAREAEFENLQDRLKHLTDDKYFKKVPRARTPERQVELDEILMSRRAEAVLLDAKTKARLAGDEDRVDAIMKLAKPFAKKHDLVMRVFRDKRAEKKKNRVRKNAGRE